MRWGRARGDKEDRNQEPFAGTVPDPDTADAGAVKHVAGATVEGERDIPSVNHERSIQSRVNNALALMVMTVVGGGFLFWYYTATFQRQNDARLQLERERAAKAAGDMKLPPLGPVEGPRAASSDVRGTPDAGPTWIGDVMGPAPALPAPGGAVAAGGPQGSPQKTPAELAMERKLAPSVHFRAGTQGVAMTAGVAGDRPAPAVAGVVAASGGPASIGNYLTPTATPATSAQVLASRRFVIPKGNFVDCTLETALDSQLPGLATCVTAFDIFGADGKVVLIERGSKLVGETKGEVRQGMNRVFVLWNEARTPAGVVVQLASPATDELGRSGLPGQVDSHFWTRFGAAVMISVIDGTVQALAQSQNRGNGSPSVVYNPQGQQQIMTEVLRNTIAIPPTVIKNQGERVQVLVARDVDFRPVYELKATN